MARQQTVLQVLVASPSDVRSEREALEHVIEELNLAWSQTLAIRLELVAWETHANPGLGNDAQDVINRQIRDNYDVFIGIMWNRFGTPTSHAGSGTEEEFDRAVKRLREGSEPLDLMLYFKDAPIAPSRIDATQLGKVNEFRARAAKEGALYQTFSETSEFESLVRIHLSKIVQEWLRRAGGVTAFGSSGDVGETTSRVPSIELDEPGFLDLVESSVAHMVEATSVTERIGQANEALTEQITLRTKAMNELVQSGRSGDVKAIKRVTNLAADDMEQFVARMRLETPVFAEHYEAAISELSQSVALSPEIASADGRTGHVKSLEELASVVSSLQVSMSNGRQSMNELRNTIASLPRLTTAFNRAKRLSVAVLDEYVREIDSALTLTSEVEKRMRSIIEDLNGSQE